MTPTKGAPATRAVTALRRACRRGRDQRSLPYHLLALPTIGAEAVAMADAAFTQRLTHETFLVEILTAECDESHARRRFRRVEEAKFPRNKRLSGVAVRYARLDLLCLDEVGNVRLDPPGRRTSVPDHHLARRTSLNRLCLKCPVLRMGCHVHRPPPVRRRRGPAHLQRAHHPDRQPVLPTQRQPPDERGNRRLTKPATPASTINQ